MVLGSGGARGLAHMGVLNVLEENGIPIDYVAGVSIGAIIGAYYAINLEIKTLEQKTLKLTKKDLFFKLFDISSPKRGLIAGKKIKKFINKQIGDKSFSDTKIPLTIIATDLCSGKEIRINKGNLIDSIIASISIPGIFPPIELNNNLLVDGGVVNPNPINVVKEMGADIIICVDLTTSSLAKLKNPTIIETLLQSFEILRNQTARFNEYRIKDAIFIRPDISGKLNVYKFYETKKFIEEGERAAREVLPKIKDLLETKQRAIIESK